MNHSRILLLSLTLFASLSSSAETLVEQGYNDMYNLQFSDAHAAFAKYEAMEPNDPVGPVSDAAAYLFSEFDRLHILQSQFFANHEDLASLGEQHPDLKTKAKFDDDLQKAQRLASIQLKEPSERVNALFAETLRLGLHADYLALIERRDIAALGDVKQARGIAGQLLSQDPTYFDAYIAVGVENYLLSLKPAPVRWMLRMGGAETDKQNGLEKLKLTADRGHYLMPYARLLLAVAALRDGDKKKARDSLAWLIAHYPQNTLYR